MSEVKTPTPESGAVKPTASHEAMGAAGTASSQQDSAAVPEPILGFIAPYSLVGKELGKIGHEFQTYRKQSIDALPAAIVNHSSNFVGLTQLVGEVFMFKSGGTQLYGGRRDVGGKPAIDYMHGNFQSWLESKHPTLAYSKNPSLASTALRTLNPILEPAHNILSTTFSKSRVEMPKIEFTPRGLYAAGSRTFNNLFNLESATKTDLAQSLSKLSAEEKLIYPAGKLVNRWQTRSTLMGITGMLIATLLPDDKDKPGEVTRQSDMATNHPVQYVGHRIMTALNPLEWWDNKRAFVGLTLAVAGMFSFMTGFRNVSEVTSGLQKFHKYQKNSAHSINGCITAVAGTQLLLGVDAEQGWSRFGSTLWARMLFLPKSIGTRYKIKDPNANFYSAGQASFQSANALAFFTGGAEKKDGKVTDQKAIREEAKKLAREEKERRLAEKAASKESPSITAHTAATPEMTTTPNIQPASNDAAYTPHATVATDGAVHTLPERTNAVAAA